MRIQPAIFFIIVASIVLLPENSHANVRSANEVVELPAGLRKGINYGADPTRATLVLEAPGKGFVYVVGDFNGWQMDDAFKMNQTPDGDVFWLEITGLEENKEYVFQYWVDETIKIGDPYADKVADPWNDRFILPAVYPNLPSYTSTSNGIATVLQTGQTPYAWANTENDWVRPDKQNLVIYELLVRDFIGSHDYKDLTDTLSYLKRLGVNAIELMPIMEFEGNESWGYNPTYFFAPDKYYGSKNDLKAFVEAAHQQGMAVILDMVLNHAYGQNAMVKMYWDGQANKPSADNPWFNRDATHPYNVGYDFNHESDYTKAFADSVNHYWLSEFHFDGFRFDLSKGFTQTKNTDVGLWSQRDESRIAIIKRMASKIKAVDPTAYIILEHFADQSEENELIADGMLVWGNSTYEYGDLLTGKTTANISSASSKGKVSYMESHDEERLMYKASVNGAGSSTYTIKDPQVGLNRVKMLAAFFYTLPGPKMMWQFQELGYDKSINFNGRVGNKPLVWGAGSLNYYNDTQRQSLYNAHAALINLVNDHRRVFNEGQFGWSIGGDVKTIKLDHAEMDVVIIGNFALSEKESTISFTHNGAWYDYFTGNEISIATEAKSFVLQPGEFHIYTDIPLNTPEPGIVKTYTPVVKTDPAQFDANTEVTITFHADLASAAGTGGLIGSNKVFMVAGAVVDQPFGNNVGYLKGETDGLGEMSLVGDNEWEVTLNPREFFGVPDEEPIYRIGLYFRNEDGSALGKGGDDDWIYLNLKSDAAIVSVDPEVFRPDQEITIVFDAAAADPAGTAGLIGASKVYMHSGIITNGPEGAEWEYVVGNWGKDDGIGAMTKVAGDPNKWSVTIKPRDYYVDAPMDSKWYRIGMVFRNADGSAEGKAEGGEDIFVNFAEVTSVLYQDRNLEILVYPNPTQGELMIFTLSTIDQISLFNLAGNLIKGNLNFRKANGYYSVSLKGFRAGMYLLHMSTSEGGKMERIIVE